MIERGDNKIKVVFGTKGRRPREMIILNQQRALNAVNAGLQIAKKQNAKLINTQTLKQAMVYWHNNSEAVGLTGIISPHSLRYAFALDAMTYYIG